MNYNDLFLSLQDTILHHKNQLSQASLESPISINDPVFKALDDEIRDVFHMAYESDYTLGSNI